MTKKITFLMLLIFSAIKISAEDVNIVFTGSDADGNNSTIESIVVTNTRTNVTETLVGTTELTFTNVVASIAKFPILDKSIQIIPNGTEGQKLTFNSTNTGLTHVYVSGMDGRIISNATNFLQAGSNSFELTLPKGIFIVKVIGSGYNYSAKVINQYANGNKSSIRYTGITGFSENSPLKAKKISNFFGQTIIGDIILFISTDKNGNISYVVDPISIKNRNINFNFLVCKDADGKNYPTVRIGSQVWMAENLASTKYNDGTVIPLKIDNTEWAGATTGAYCYMDNNFANLGKLGALYNFHAVKTGKLAPKNWHVPTYDEFRIVNEHIKNKSIYSAAAYKSTSPNSWIGDNYIATNAFGFSALPSGFRNLDGTFNNPAYPLGTEFHMWLADFNNLGIFFGINSYFPELRKIDFDIDKEWFKGLSVRCVKDVAPPVITTKSVESITATSAIIGGDVLFDGATNITERGICWSTNKTIPPTIALNTKNLVAGTTGAFTSSITGLSPNTTYYVRAYAKNAAGTTYGEILSFTTAVALPTLTTTPVSSITSSTASSGGNVSSDGGATITARGICWSTSENPTKDLPTNAPATGTTGEFTSPITGLTLNTTYYVRAYATNSAGTTYGTQVSFSTLLPTVTTTAISAITTSSASSGGNVTAIGGAAVTARGVCWSTSENPTVNSQIVPATGTTGAFTSLITGLTLNTTYHVRAYATNSLGTAYGTQVSFSTLANPPTLTTTPVSNITSTTATSGGDVSSNGGAPITARGICWSTNPGPTKDLSTRAEATATTGVFTSSMSNLTPNTTYNVRAYASNSAGTTYGEPVIFSTTLPTVTTTAISVITATSASSGGNVTLSFGGAAVTARGICWSTSVNPTKDIITRDEATATTGEFTSSITGLTPNTTYNVRAYATNSVGTTYGDNLIFKTQDIKIGDTYEGGIIGYILQSGDIGYDANVQKGYIISSSDLGSGTNWSSAKATCSSSTLNGKDDWFLPTFDELQIIFNNANAFIGFGPFEYWTSTEDSDNPSNAKSLSGFGGQNSLDKNTPARVRAVRKF